MRETHVQDLTPANQTSKLQVGFSYSDGLGRVIQQKSAGGTGPAGPRTAPSVDPRWIGSGWTIFNNKGKPVRQYEPFFNATQDFEFGADGRRQLDACSTTRWGGSWRRSIPTRAGRRWSSTRGGRIAGTRTTPCLITDPSADPDVGAYFLRMPAADYMPTWYAQRSAGALGAEEQDAARKPRSTPDTPATVHFDTLGRAFLTLAFNR